MSKKEIWKTKSHKEDKPWGTTQVWTAHGTVQGKIITINAGARTSLKYNLLKNEVFYVLSGSVLITFGNSRTLSHPELNPYETVTLEVGEFLSVQSECPYRIQALESSILVEVATTQDSRAVILEDDYGRVMVKEDK